MKPRYNFVADGYRRARCALRPEIQAAVEAEFAEQMRRAGFFERLRFSWQAYREFCRRLHAKAPPDALY